MKKILIFLSLKAFFLSQVLLAQELSPYIKVGERNENITRTQELLQDALIKKGFVILGDYSPAARSGFRVIAFSREDLQKITSKVTDRGTLAAVLKIGLKYSSMGTIITYVNPEYIFNAYMRKDYQKYQEELMPIVKDMEDVLWTFAAEFTPFGGAISASELQEYQYKALMPNFDDAVILKTFNSFEEGVKIIDSNLKSKVGNTRYVYKLELKNEKIAIFGVGLHEPKRGEKYFLPIIGEDHIAALPYEIILQDKTATMLHGRYRIALHWPSLTMGTFMKIMGTPGDIEQFLKAVCN